MTKDYGMIEFDGQKLKEEIYKRNKMVGSLAEELGFERSYISHAISRNTIKRGSLMVVCKMLDIPVEDVLKKEEPKKQDEEQEEEQKTDKNVIFSFPKMFMNEDEFWKTLRMVILSSVTEAVRTVWNEPYTGTGNK